MLFVCVFPVTDQPSISGRVRPDAPWRDLHCGCVRTHPTRNQVLVAVTDIRERLDRVFLPKDAERPLVLRYDPSLDPVIPNLHVAIGTDYAKDSATLDKSQSISCFPPVSGG